MKRLNVKVFLGVIVLFLLIFQAPLQDKIGFIQFVDELVSIFCLIYYINYFIKKKHGIIEKKEFKITISIVIITIIGILGALLYKYQTNILLIMKDFLSFFKYIFTFLGALYIFKNMSDDYKNELLRTTGNILLFVTYITFIFMIINTLYGVSGMTYEIRYGLRAFQFIYEHAGNLNTITTFISIVFIGCIFRFGSSKYKIGLLLNVLILFSTLRSRAWIVAALILLLMYVYYIKKEKRNSKLIVVLGIALAFFIAYGQIDAYFISSDRSPRSDLLKGGIQMMSEHFPMGTGFGTYGSNVASENYSVLYSKLGFQNYYGMSPSNPIFLKDNFWPIVFSQFGFIGVIFYVYLLFNLLKIMKLHSNSPMKKVIILLIMLNLFFNSAVSSSFVHYSAVTYMLLLTLFINYDGDECYEKN